MKTRVLSFLLCLALCLMPPAALGAARMPDEREFVTDDADVLSAQTAQDLETYFDKVEDETDIQLHVAIVHFLDGLDAQTYADGLFDKWNLGEDDLLVLGAAGEDSFAAVMGQDVQKELGKTNADNLLYTSSQFASLFRSQQYDAAFAAYCTAFNQLVKKQMDANISMNGLFGQTASQARQERTYASDLWDQVMDSISESSVDYQNNRVEREHEENGLTAGGWIVLVVLIWIVFHQDKKQKRYGGSRKERKGCMGWLFGLLGISALVNLLRGNRH